LPDAFRASSRNPKAIRGTIDMGKFEELMHLWPELSAGENKETQETAFDVRPQLSLRDREPRTRVPGTKVPG